MGREGRWYLDRDLNNKEGRKVHEVVEVTERGSETKKNMCEPEWIKREKDPRKNLRGSPKNGKISKSKMN